MYLLLCPITISHGIPFISKDWFDCAVQVENVAVGELSNSKSKQMRNLHQRRPMDLRQGSKEYNDEVRDNRK
jgi:hypothetical protein